jgi:rod shape-determining protein MreD
MRILFMALAVVATVVFQAAVLPVYLDTHFRPDLLLIFTVFFALRGSFQSGTPLAWGLGLLKDVFSGVYLGLNAFTFLIIFLVIKSMSDRLYAESGFLFVVTVVVATLACITGNFLLLLMFTKTQGIAYSMSSALIPNLLINAFAASLVALLPCFNMNVEAP